MRDVCKQMHLYMDIVYLHVNIRNIMVKNNNVVVSLCHYVYMCESVFVSLCVCLLVCLFVCGVSNEFLYIHLFLFGHLDCRTNYLFDEYFE